jgi:3-hydroxyisobutyrate dehydrogenase-like beta-hydroxyacid dehydrogenase
MKPTVAIIAQGSMGAGVARRLVEHNVTVLTSLTGRSAASAQRADEAGMRAVDEPRLAEADFLLSIVPPGEALALAHRLAPVLAAATHKPVYVECNAIGPRTMLKVAETMNPTGCTFVGAAIIGPPPKPGSSNTKFYAAGPFAKNFAVLNEYGLIVRVLDGPLTAASALKMSYAGITKGFTALGAAMMLAATRGGSAQALKAELTESQPELLRFLDRSVPGMYGKAYRWVAEMDEIADFIGEEFAESEMLAMSARFFERIAADDAGDQDEVAVLETFLAKKS